MWWGLCFPSESFSSRLDLQGGQNGSGPFIVSNILVASNPGHPFRGKCGVCAGCDEWDAVWEDAVQHGCEGFSGAWLGCRCSHFGDCD